jgi:hypothetical protein
MNLSHAAVLALIGWYLMVPPPPNNDYEQLAPKAALSSWVEIDDFSTLRQCKNGIERALNENISAEIMVDFGLLRCVASNDPRLKEN